jgi:hypothetical protein
MNTVLLPSRALPAGRIGILLLLGAQLVLAGCASCHMAHIYKLHVVSPGDVAVHAEQRKVAIGIAGDATLQVGECSGLYEKTQAGVVDLCVLMWVADGRVFQWASVELQATAAGGGSYAWPMGPMQYHVYYKPDRDALLQPDSLPIVATAAPVRATPGVQHQGRRHDHHEFDASAPFVGAASTAYPALARLISPTARLRQYMTRSTVPLPPGRGFLLKLPGARVDGKPYDLPQIEFNHTYEKVCPPSA